MFHVPVLSCHFCFAWHNLLMFFFVTMISFFRASISCFGAEMVDFNSCTSSLSLLFSSTSSWFSMTLQADSPISAQSGCLFVAILEFVQIIWWPELGFSWGVQVRFGYLFLRMSPCIIPFKSSNAGEGGVLVSVNGQLPISSFKKVTNLKDLFESGNMKFESLVIDLQLQLLFFL